MDTITHGITGALIGKAFFDTPRRAGATETAQMGRVAIWAATLGAIAPDGDSVFSLFGKDELAILDIHRGLTHSFVFLPVFALILAAGTRWLARRRNWAAPSFARLWLIYAAGLASHILLDLITSFGTMIWSPLSNVRAAWDLIFIIDFTFTAIVLLPQLAAWVYHNRAGSFTRRLLAWTFCSVSAVGVDRLARAGGATFSPWVVAVAVVLLAALFFLPARHDWGFRVSRAAWCRAGCIALVLYLGLSFATHRVALARVENFAASQGIQVESLAALPLPPSVLRWNGLVRTPTGVYQSWMDLLDRRTPAFRYFANSPPNEYIAAARALPSVQRYLWFARFPLVTYRQEDGRNVVDFTDLRFFSRRGQKAAGFTFRVTMDNHGRVLKEGWLEE